MKQLLNHNEMVQKINSALLSSEEADGDCKRCQVKSVARVTDAESMALDRNWNVGMVNGDCRGDCYTALDKIVSALGKDFEVAWP
jgi:hypothetical protein